MEEDERLTPLPRALQIQPPQNEYPAGYTSFYDDESLANKRSLRQYINVVYKRWPIILTIAILVTGIVSLYSFHQASIFQATSELLISPRKADVTQKDSININFGGDQNYYNTQRQLLQNPDLMKKVVISLGLQREPNLLGDENRGLLSGLFGRNKTGTDNTLPVIDENALASTDDKLQLSPEEEARAAKYAASLLGNLKVEQTENTDLFTISVQSTNPPLTAKVADRLAEEYIAEDAKRELEGTQAAYDELTRSIGELKGTIAEQENELTDYMRSSNLPLQEKGQDLSANRLQTISVQWLTAADDRRKLEARYNAAVEANNRGQGMNIPDLYDNKIFQDTMRLNTERKAKLQDQIRDIDKQIKDAEAKKAELLVKYTPEYFEVKQIDERISSLSQTKSQTESEVGQIIDRDQKKIEKDAVGGALVALKSQLDAATRRESDLLGAYERESGAANVQGQAETKLTTLKRGLETNRGLLDTYTQRQKEQELALAAGKPSNIKISNHAATPTQPVGPNRGRNIIIALLVSLAAGVGLAFLLDYLDDSVKNSEDVSRHLGLPTLAFIPFHTMNERRKLRIGGRNSNPASAALITLEERHSAMSEAYRHLRTSLLFSSAGKPPQTILVTSAQPSEGKTTTAINTAITLAQADADVILIDCDLRRPRLHSHFGLDNVEGLTNYLSGEKTNENLIKPVADLPRLKVITSGPVPPNPAELLSSNEMRNLLQFLRGRFKHVVIDSPPAISFTDAAILSTQVDGVVLVALAGSSSIHLMRQFRRRLASVGARIYGVVLNGIKAGSIDYGYYGSGYYDYYKADDDASMPVMEENESAHVGQN